MHLNDVPPFEGGRALDDCELSADLQRDMQGWENRCVVLSQNEASDRLDAYLKTLAARGWQQGGMAGSAVWVLIPADGDCAQVFAIVASDYPRGSRTTETSEFVLDFNLEQRLRCGDERNLR